MLFSVVLGHKASVHTSDAPSPGPSLRNYIPDLKNAHARARARTHTHPHTGTPSPLSSGSSIAPLWASNEMCGARKVLSSWGGGLGPAKAFRFFQMGLKFLLPIPPPAPPRARRDLDLKLRCPNSRLGILPSLGILALAVKEGEVVGRGVGVGGVETGRGWRSVKYL